MGICVPAIPQVPSSYAETLKTFGNIAKYVRADGTIDPKWEAEHIVRIPLPSPVAYAYGSAKITQVTIHRLLEPLGRMLYAELWDAGLVGALGPYGGGYVYRAVRGSAKVSLHSFGLAWDWDPAGFPLGSLKKRDPKLVAIFEKWGFRCGEKFAGRKDPMHFEFSTGF